MKDAQGRLTPVQHEIMDVVWRGESDGLTVAEIWKAVSSVRRVGRTTVQNLVDRLEKRGWLNRRDSDSPIRFVPAVDRQTTSTRLAGDFVEDFFGGSATRMVMSLLGSDAVDAEELKRLNALLAEANARRAGGES